MRIGGTGSLDRVTTGRKKGKPRKKNANTRPKPKGRPAKPNKTSGRRGY